ncbi:hypothetical protein HYPSUDRAFT_47001 [Hypholoma sublateritium FD-334 SS-4]|uniref:F-box domain-containing protein n=1 Tax=Hypholoma sublateritium (strain FD-334 SS-4) TaxID=945553 RepID=A0A0D2KQ59_HYPSF|nr:hypothetical protein HYPSUDRAFT_47001 [Hypholoma sublateritium FD-334 SS-4]
METPSPFVSLLGTNYAATSEEATKLSEFLAGPMCKLNELQGEIFRVKALYDALTEQHTELSCEISRHQALMAPIRRLPVDIIQEIFVRCLPTAHDAIISPRECPILLTRICSGWRHIALKTAALWASIHVPIPTDTVPGYYTPPSWPSPTQPSSQFASAIAIADRRARAIKTWLERSGECTLSISLYDREHTTHAAVYKTILDALIPFSRRWRVLKCQTPARSVMSIASIPSSDLPFLDSLTICGSSAHGVFPASPGVIAPGGVGLWAESGVVRAPRLRSISYNNITEDFTNFPLQWPQLTSISLQGITWPAAEAMSVPRLAAVLARCRDLRYCSLEIASLRNGSGASISGALDELPPKTIALPHLKTLIISAGRNNLSMLLDALDVPVLVHLEVHALLPSPSSLLALLRRTAHTLHELAIDPQTFTPSEVFACLETCTGLTKLSLLPNYLSAHQAWTPPSLHQNWGGGGGSLPGDAAEAPVALDDVFLRRVLVPGTGTILLPRLMALVCHVGDFSDTCVLEVIQERVTSAARDGSVASMTYFEVVFGRPQENPMADAVKDLEDVGVTCVLSYGSPLPLNVHSPSDGIASPGTPLPWVPIF